MRIKKLLFPTDFSRCADQALRHALYLADRYGAELHMLHAIVLHEDDPNNPAFHFPGLEEIQAQLRSMAGSRMNEALRTVERVRVPVRQVQVRGLSTAPVIVDYALENDIDLIVMGTQGRRGIGHLLLGSVAEEVVRTASCPVLTIRERKNPPPPVEAINCVLVPVDFSRYARQALAYAKALADGYEARLQLLHVIEESMHPAFYNMGVTSIFDLVPEIEQRTLAALREFYATAGGPDLAVDYYAVRGRAARDIVRFAEQNATDLIVIATHGLTGLEHLFLGSVTEKVVRRATCPVFTAKAFGKSLLEAEG